MGAVAVLTDAGGRRRDGAAMSACLCSIHPDPRSVLGELAATVYGHPSDRLRVIGVTGTSGKTTTTVSWRRPACDRRSGSPG